MKNNTFFFSLYVTFLVLLYMNFSLVHSTATEIQLCLDLLNINSLLLSLKSLKTYKNTPADIL